MTYPAAGAGGSIPGATYSFSVDGLGRYTGMTYVGVATMVSGVQYNAASQLTQMSYEGWTETRQYNALNQLTRITVPGAPGQNPVADWEYRFSASANNGRITQMKDWVTGEEVSYSYDALNRLIAATTTGPEWGLSFGYDGFGNKLTQALTKGSAPVHSLTVNASNNRINGFTYDANGNQLPTGTATYDIDNRLRQYQSGGEMYAYGSDNRRLWKYVPGVGGEVTFWVGGRLASYNMVFVSGTNWHFTEKTRNVWFGGKLIRTGPVAGQASVIVDRLGSVRVSKVGSTVERLDYWPYGEEKPGATGQGRDKFATYLRDGTGLDYADQRYYSSTGLGRFMTPDPAADWLNRYSSTRRDPANAIDPSGLVLSGEWLLGRRDLLCV